MGAFRPRGQRGRAARCAAAALVALVAAAGSWRDLLPARKQHAFVSSARPAPRSSAPLGRTGGRRTAAGALAGVLQPPVETNYGEESLTPEREIEARHRMYTMANTVALTSEEELDQVVKRAAEEGRLVVITYYASWCRACHKLLSGFQKVAREDAFREVLFAHIDFKRCHGMLKEKGVKKLPALEIYRDGEVRQRWSGAKKDRAVERLRQEMEDTGIEQDALVAIPNMATA